MHIGIIGINIYAKFLNFACDLHALAFQEFLKSEGHDVTILDYKPVHFGGFDMRRPQAYANRRYQSALKRTANTPEEEAENGTLVRKWKTLSEGYESVKAEREIRFDKFQRFAEKHLHLSKQQYNSDLLEVLDPGLDCYMCVTDVIWQPVEHHKFDRGFLLGSRAFEGKPKIAYAASRGAAKDYSVSEKEQFLQYLADIDEVSVREEDFKEYIDEISGTNVTTVLDPVMLHGSRFWARYTAPPKEKGFVLLYYVMEKSTDTIQKAVDYAKAKDLTLVELSDRPLKDGIVTDPDVRHISRHDVGMDEWLGYIRDAQAVFTNSFHGCCFSVIFEKQLFVGPRNGSKVPNFLAAFGLTAQQFDSTTHVSELNEEIDFTSVRRHWNRERSISEGFVRKALSKAKQTVSRSQLIDHSRYDAARRQLAYEVRLHSGAKVTDISVIPEAESKGFVSGRVPSGALEGTFQDDLFTNDGSRLIPGSPFLAADSQFEGWNIRFKIDNFWFWFLEDGTFLPRNLVSKNLELKKLLAKPGETMPYLPVNNIRMLVMEAVWR